MEKRELTHEELIMKYAHIPEQYWKTQAEWIEPLPHLDIDKSYFLYGKPGAGKTMCAAWWLKQQIINDQNAWHLFVRSSDLVAMMRGGFEDNSSYAILGEYLEVNYLVFDDLGTEKITPWVIEQIYCVVSKRESDRMPTVFTSNYSLAEISKIFGERISSRLNGMCQVIKFSGDDLRAKYKGVK